MGVTRPIAENVLAHIFKITGLPKDTPIIHQGPTNTAKLEGSDLEGSLNSARFGQSERVFIVVKEGFVQEDLLTMQTHAKEAFSIFRDLDLGVELSPLYSQTELNISILFRAGDRPSAERWRNGLRRKIAEGRQAVMHEISYQYIVPKKLIGLLVDIYNLRENLAPYNEALQDWFKRCWSSRATTLVNMAGKEPELAISEIQNKAIGFFDFDTPPEHEKKEEGSVWEVSIEYKLRYDKPISVRATYPLIVHQQRLGERWFDREGPYTAFTPKQAPSVSRHAYDALVAQQQARRNRAVDGVQFPVYDDWLPRDKAPHTSSVFRLLVTVSPDDLHDVLNINSIGPFELQPLYLNYLLKYRQYVWDPNESVLLFELFEGSKVRSDAVLNADGSITTTKPMDLRKVYHLRLSALNDLHQLTPGAQERFRKDGDFAIDFIKGLGYDKVNPTDKSSTGVLPKPVFNKAADEIENSNSKYRGADEIVRLYVSYFIVEAHRSAELENTKSA